MNKKWPVLLSSAILFTGLSLSGNPSAPQDQDQSQRSFLEQSAAALASTFTIPQAEALTLSQGQKIIAAGKKYLGKPYEFGSNRNTTTTFDCSDFTRQAYWDALRVRIAADSRSQGSQVKKAGHAKYSTSSLKPGDLVFFMSYRGNSASAYKVTKSKQTITHVAIYLGNNRLLHTYSKASGGVRYSTFDGTWKYRFLFGGSPV